MCYRTVEQLQLINLLIFKIIHLNDIYWLVNNLFSLIKKIKNFEINFINGNITIVLCSPKK